MNEDPPATTRARRLPAFLSAFIFPHYRRLWTGAFLSSIGTWTQDVALAWLIHTELQRPIYLGLRAFAAEAPLLAFMLLGGAVADRVDRRRILLTSQVLQMGFAAALLGLYLSGALGIGAILLLAFLTGLAQSQSAPTYQAVITSIVPPRQIPNAVALNSLQFNLSRAVGPVVAGLLLAHVGTAACFAVNVVSFLAVIVALWRLRVPALAERPRVSWGESLRQGLRHVARSRALSGFTLLGLAGSFLAFPLITYMPVIADEVTGSGAAGYSLLLSSFGAGAIAGALATAQRGHAVGRGRLLLLAFAAYAVAVVGVVLSRRQWLSMALLLVAGFALVSAFSTLNSFVQEHAEESLRGRILSIYGLAFRGGNPLGSLAAGALAQALGTPAVIGCFAALLGLIAAGVWVWRPELRRL